MQRAFGDPEAAPSTADKAPLSHLSVRDGSTRDRPCYDTIGLFHLTLSSILLLPLLILAYVSGGGKSHPRRDPGCWREGWSCRQIGAP